MSIPSYHNCSQSMSLQFMAGNQTIRYDRTLISEHGDTMLCDQGSQFSQKIWYDTICVKSSDKQRDAIRLDLQKHPGDTIPYNYVCWKCQKLQYDTIIFGKPARRYDKILSIRENWPDDKIRCDLTQRSRYDPIQFKIRLTMRYDQSPGSRRLHILWGRYTMRYDTIRYDIRQTIRYNQRFASYPPAPESQIHCPWH